jgi:hypothetical protein
MKSSSRIFSLARLLTMAVFAGVFAIPANAQLSFFKNFSPLQQVVLNSIMNNAGITANDSAYYSTSMQLLIETDLGGHVQWGREFLYNNSYIELCSVEDRAGGGYSGAGMYNDMQQQTLRQFIFRLDNLGNTIWSKELLNNITNVREITVAEAADGGLGICKPFGIMNGQGGAWVGKTDSLGNLLWTIIIRNGASAVTRGSKITPTLDGGFIVTSKVSFSNSTTPHTGLSRLDANGNLLWTKTYDGAGPNDLPHAIQCADGGFAIAGSGTPLSTESIRLCRTDSAGNLLWSTSYFTLPYLCFAHKVQETADRGFIISGDYYNMNIFDFIPIIIRTDSAGNTRWARQLVYTSLCNSTSWDVEETPDGGFLVPGSELSMIKTDPNGDISCVSFPVTITEAATTVSQTSSLDFVNGGTLIPVTFINNLLPFIDTTHCAGEFSPTGITAHDAIDELTVFPNPSEGLFTLQFENGNATYDVVVYNATGQIVRRYKNTSAALQIDLTAAADGIYFVRVTDHSGKRSAAVKLLKK